MMPRASCATAGGPGPTQPVPHHAHSSMDAVPPHTQQQQQQEEWKGHAAPHGLYALSMPPSSPLRSSSNSGVGFGGNNHLLLAEEERQAASRVQSGRASPDAADFGRRMSITHDHPDAWVPAQAQAHPLIFQPSGSGPLQHLQQREWKQGISLSQHTSMSTSPIALNYHSSPAVAATSTSAAATPPTSVSPVPSAPHSRQHQPQQMYFHGNSSSHGMSLASSTSGSASSSGYHTPAVPLKRSTLPLPSSQQQQRRSGLVSAPSESTDGNGYLLERCTSAPSGDQLASGQTQQSNGREHPQHQQTPHLAASTVIGNFPAHQLPVQLQGAYHATYLHMPRDVPPTLSRDASLDALSFVDGVSVCSSSTSSSRNSPSRIFAHGGASASAFISSISSVSASHVVSKSNSQTQLHQLSPRERTPEPHSNAFAYPNITTFTAVQNQAAFSTAAPGRGVHRRAHSSQPTLLPTSEDCEEARSPLSPHKNMGSESQSVQSSQPTSTEAGVRRISASNAPSSVDSSGSVGSLNVAVEQLAGPSTVSPSVGHNPMLPELPSMSRSESNMSASSTTSGRNANNKRARSDLEGEAGAYPPAPNVQLKTSSTAAASSVQVEAQHARSSLEQEAIAAAAAANAAAAAQATAAAVAAAAAAAVVPASLAPDTPKRQALISVLSCVLSQLFSNPLDQLPSDARLLTRFHTERLPSISIGAYLERIAHYSECSDEALVMAFIHISRVSHNKPHFHLNALSIHRLLLTAIMCTVKFFDDAYYNNAFYAKIGGVALREMNALEVDFLELVQFELYIDTRVYVRFYEELRNSVLHPQCHCQYERMADVDHDAIANPPAI